MPYSPASSNFPTSLTTFTDPSATSDTAVFDHAGLENAQNDGIEKLEAAIGTTGSGDSSTLTYKLTNASSTDPGHVHTTSSISGQVAVAQGGTGQSSLTSNKVLVGNGTSAVSIAKDAPSGDFVGTTDTQELTNKTVTTPTLTLKQGTSPTPTAEGDIQWDTDDNRIKIGDGSGTKTFSDDSYTLSRSNHTGTQAASTISDFDTEVENNTQVALNTAARHSAVTVTDSSSVDFTLTGQDITAAVLPAGVDHASLNNLNSSSYTHLTAANHTDLTDSGDSSLHYHSTDRNRTNHTGTQTASTISDFSESVEDIIGTKVVAGSNVTVTYDDTAGTTTIASTGGGGSISDGDKGDITVSSSGAVWTIDNDVVTYAKMQNVSATDKVLGRSTSGAGDVEEITMTAAGRALVDDADNTAQRTTLGLGTLATQSGTFSGTSSGTNTGDQNLFSTIAVSGQSNVVADTTTDTLTLVAGSNVTITTDASTDSITIASTGGSGSPGGSNTQVQFNDSSAFGGDAGLTYNKTNDTLTITGSADAKHLIVKGHSTQTSVPVEFQNSAGTAIFDVKNDGTIRSLGGIHGYSASQAVAVFGSDSYLTTAYLNVTGNTYGTFPGKASAEFVIGNDTGAAGVKSVFKLVSQDYVGGFTDRLLLEGSSGNMSIGGGDPLGRLHVNGTADDQQLIIEAHSTQTSNLVEFHNSSSAVQLAIHGNGRDFVLDTTTGSKIGTSTSQKLAFYNSTPIVQPGATTDLGTVLSNLGLRASGTAYPITTSGTVALTGGLTVSTTALTITDVNIVLSATTGTKIGTATTQKLGFYNATPIVQPSAYTASNVTTDRSYDCNSTTIDEVADVLGTLITDLKSLGLIG